MGHHLNERGEFQSDKHPDLPPDRIRLNLRNPRSVRALRVLAQDHQDHDPELAADLRARLGHLHGVGEGPQSVESWHLLALDAGGRTVHYQDVGATEADRATLTRVLLRTLSHDQIAQVLADVAGKREAPADDEPFRSWRLSRLDERGQEFEVHTAADLPAARASLAAVLLPESPGVVTLAPGIAPPPRDESAWSRWREENIIPNGELAGRHKEHPTWKVIGVWQLERDDGRRTPHKAETPWVFWEAVVEESMRLLDKFVPLGEAFPEGAHTVSDLSRLEEQQLREHFAKLCPHTGDDPEEPECEDDRPCFSRAARKLRAGDELARVEAAAALVAPTVEGAMEFCPHCGYEKLPGSKAMFCRSCSEFEVKAERMRRLNPQHLVDELATLNPDTLLPIEGKPHPITADELGHVEAAAALVAPTVKAAEGVRVAQLDLMGRSFTRHHLAAILRELYGGRVKVEACQLRLPGDWLQDLAGDVRGVAYLDTAWGSLRLVAHGYLRQPPHAAGLLAGASVDLIEVMDGGGALVARISNAMQPRGQELEGFRDMVRRKQADCYRTDCGVEDKLCPDCVVAGKRDA